MLIKIMLLQSPAKGNEKPKILQLLILDLLESLGEQNKKT
jgi:hypothetical protein